MSSGVKTGLMLALIVALIFGVTVISQLTPKTTSGPGSSAQAAAEKPVLALFGNEYHFDPNAPDETYYNRYFKGFLEVGSGGETNRNWTSFVVQSVYPEPIHLSPLKPSCPKCTTARAAAVSLDELADFTRLAAVSQWAASGGVPNPIAALAWAAKKESLTWFTFDLANPKQTFTVPASSALDRPVWVLIDLNYTVSVESAPSKVSAWFEVLNAKNEKLMARPLELSTTYAGREQFELWPKTLEAGEFPEGTAPRTFDVFAFSMTRDLDKPPAAIAGNNDPAIAIGPAVKLNADECRQLAVAIGTELKGAVRVISGFKYPVTLRRQPDQVGDFEKAIEFAGADASRSFRLPIKGAVTGSVVIDGARKFELGSYDSSGHFKKDFRLVTSAMGVDLDLVASECSPRFVQFKLDPPVTSFGQTSWILHTEIAAQQGRRPHWTGKVVLRTKGPNPVTYNLSITGHGY